MNKFVIDDINCCYIKVFDLIEVLFMFIREVMVNEIDIVNNEKIEVEIRKIIFEFIL